MDKTFYLLSKNHNFSNAMSAAMINKYKSVGSRHHFNLYINLFEDGNEFKLNSIKYSFAGTKSYMLKKHNDSLLSWEESKIIENIKNKNLHINNDGLIGLCTIASIIKMCKRAGCKYVYLPITLNYGRVNNLLHQTSLIIDLNGIFMYYEPYGRYIKYDKKYDEVICNLFHVFDGCNLFNEKNIICNTYHNIFNMSEGIQTIIMKKNNEQAVRFNIEYDKALAEVKRIYPGFREPPENTTQKDDYTYKIVNLLYALDGREVAEVLECYGKYGSKTCVSITLVEMDAFFNCMSKNIPVTFLNNFYNEFRVEMPNYVLMAKLDALLNK
jgi:hypothetical protein